MFTMNGIVYAGEKPKNIEIVNAQPLEDMMMILTFSSGEQLLFDATVLSGPAFQPLSASNSRRRQARPFPRRGGYR